MIAVAFTTPDVPSRSACFGICGATVWHTAAAFARAATAGAGGGGGAIGAGGATGGGATAATAGAVDGGGVTSAGGTYGGGGASAFTIGFSTGLGGGGGGGGGGGMITSWITAASIGFLMMSRALRAVPVMRAQPMRMCSAMTAATP